MRTFQGVRDLWLCLIGKRKTALFPQNSLNNKKIRGDLSQLIGWAGGRGNHPRKSTPWVGSCKDVSSSLKPKWAITINKIDGPGQAGRCHSWLKGWKGHLPLSPVSLSHHTCPGKFSQQTEDFYVLPFLRHTPSSHQVLRLSLRQPREESHRLCVRVGACVFTSCDSAGVQLTVSLQWSTSIDLHARTKNFFPWRRLLYEKSCFWFASMAPKWSWTPVTFSNDYFAKLPLKG